MVLLEQALWVALLREQRQKKNRCAKARERNKVRGAHSSQSILPRQLWENQCRSANGCDCRLCMGQDDWDYVQFQVAQTRVITATAVSFIYLAVSQHSPRCGFLWGRRAIYVLFCFFALHCVRRATFLTLCAWPECTKVWCVLFKQVVSTGAKPVEISKCCFVESACALREGCVHTVWYVCLFGVLVRLPGVKYAVCIDLLLARETRFFSAVGLRVRSLVQTIPVQIGNV